MLPVKNFGASSMDDKSLLLAMYQEQVTQARQHENLRATATNLTLVAGSILVSLVFKSGEPIVSRTAVASILIGVGLFGFLISFKHYERNRYHVAIATEYRRALERLPPPIDLGALRGEGERANSKKHPYLSRLRLHWLWSSMSLVFVIVGIAYLFFVRT
jgi:hypothetical protein